MIKVGDMFPTVTLRTMGAEGPETVITTDLFAGKRTILIGLPGAFTPGCSRKHLPGYVEYAEKFSALGIDHIACVANNDAFVMQAWAEKYGAIGTITMLSDTGELREALGLSIDLSAVGLGTRMQRFAMALDNNTVTKLGVEEDSQVLKSSAEKFYQILSADS